MSNFFRKDLNLGKKWGHRFLVVVFFLGLVVSIISAFTSTLKHPSYSIGKEITTLNSRLTSDLVNPNSLLKPGEIISNSSFIMNNEGSFFDNRSNEFYCSAEIYKYIGEVQKKTGVYSLYDLAGNKVISSQIFSDYLKEHNIYCLIIDEFQNGNRVLRARKLDDYSFYKVSFLEDVKYNLSTIGSNLITILVFVLLLLIIYYRIILYVIYGKNKKKK